MNQQDIYRQIGRNIRRLREGRLTQAQLASAIGISRASLANIEAGRQQVLVHYLFAIAEELNLETLDRLLAVPRSTLSGDGDNHTVRFSETGLSKKQRQQLTRLIGD